MPATNRSTIYDNRWKTFLPIVLIIIVLSVNATWMIFLCFCNSCFHQSFSRFVNFCNPMWVVSVLDHIYFGIYHILKNSRPTLFSTTWDYFDRVSTQTAQKVHLFHRLRRSINFQQIRSLYYYFNVFPSTACVTLCYWVVPCVTSCYFHSQICCCCF